jgi:hypothetical protein
VATRYRQPKAINGVSVSLVLLLGVAVWVGISAWPIIAQSSNVKSELGDALPRLHRANLLPEPNATVEVERIRADLTDKVKALGVDDAAFEVAIARNDKTVSIEARYKATLILLGTRKKYPIALHPRVETDAARVDW